MDWPRIIEEVNYFYKAAWYVIFLSGPFIEDSYFGSFYTECSGTDEQTEFTEAKNIPQGKIWVLQDSVRNFS